MRSLLLIATALLLGHAVPATAASAHGRHGVTGEYPAASSEVSARRKVRKVYSEQGQIACTKLGCQRIPANCHPATAYYWNGLPTGYDRIACR
jgi:hypothetical protein